MIPTYIINLDRHIQRKNKMELQLVDLSELLDIHWFKAIDGNSDLDNEIFQVDIHWYEPIHKKPMTRGEIGCALSHYKVWEIIAEKHSYALVLEDDVIFTDKFQTQIKNQINNMPSDTDLLYIYRKILDDDEEEIGGYLQCKKSYWTCAYVVTNQGAKKLLQTNYTNALIPVDEFLPMVYDSAYRNATSYHYPTKFHAYAGPYNDLCDLDFDLAFSDSSTFHSPSYSNLESKLLVITNKLPDTTSFRRWIYSCKTYGINYDILDFTNSSDRNIYQKHCDTCQYILYLDYDYTFMLGNPIEILNGYLKAVPNQSKVLIPMFDFNCYIGPGSLMRTIIFNIDNNLIIPDSQCHVFQNVIQYDDLEVNRSVLYNKVTETHPKILCGSSLTQLKLNSLENYTLYGLKQKYGFKLPDKSPILHYVDIYAFVIDGYSLEFIQSLNIVDYPPELLQVTIYSSYPITIPPLKFETILIETDMINAHQQMILSVSDSCSSYAWLIYENFNIIHPDILFDCIRSDRDIVAPLFLQSNSNFSNFWGDLDENGYYARSFDYMDIINQKQKMLWNVPYICGNILLKKDAVMRYPSLFKDNSHLDVDMQFCHNLRLRNELMYLLNLQIYGTIAEEDEDTTIVLNGTKWLKEDYLCSEFYDFMYGNDYDARKSSVFNEVIPDVWQFPFFTEKFCDELVEVATVHGNWSPGLDYSYDFRLDGQHENYPTQDIHLNQLGLHEFWEKIVVGRFFTKIMSKLYAYKAKKYNIAFIVKYEHGYQIKLNPHHDASVYTTNIALNTAGTDYEGGGCKFLFKNASITNNPKGWVILHPGKLTHYHEGLPITAGTRYILVSFNE
jgi:GR25 family glycosyltransferase involved in LPS biosynthesis